MRVTLEKQPCLGETRVVEKFLWFPKILMVEGTTTEELRWLEKAKVKQGFACGWIDTWWVE